LQRSLDFGDGGDEYAVACVVFVRPDSGSLNVTLQRHATPSWVAAVALGREHDFRAMPSGAEMVSQYASSLDSSLTSKYVAKAMKKLGRLGS
jgi:hypothetical protein